MKARWTALAARIDALSQRERILGFAAAAALLSFAAYSGAIGPGLRKQELLRTQIVQQRAETLAVRAAIAQKVAEGAVDPDAAVRARLAAVREEDARLSESLRAMQKGLVPPERVAPLLESILRANGRLKLASVRTLPVEPLGDTRADAADGSAGAAAGVAALAAAMPVKPVAAGHEVLFRHGVELTVRGSYLDMVDYMAALESLPTQLFWGQAQLEVEEYPTVRLTLTLYTLSLDEKWMKL
jgi:MSHA biogenesis protein MshJ